jgi:hypothetical protein
MTIWEIVRTVSRRVAETAITLWQWAVMRFGKRHSVMTLTDRWLALGDRLHENGKAIFDHSDVLESDVGTKDPKVVALTLLARTIGNFAGVVALLEKDHHLVEARTLARCCYENLLWIASLAKKGEEFIHAMELDDAASRMKRANGLLDWTKQQSQNFNFVESLGKFRWPGIHHLPGTVGRLGASFGHVTQSARDVGRRR